jgi:hypothetical protein
MSPKVCYSNDMDDDVDLTWRSVRKQFNLENGSYSDKNDGFLRKYFSRNVQNRSRAYKINKQRRSK